MTTYGEQVREACAAIADAHATIEGIAQKIASEIRALPLPEAPPDEREALARIIVTTRWPDMAKAQLEADWPMFLRAADAILRAGWRRNPC